MVRTAKWVWGGALGCLLAIGFQGQGWAQPLNPPTATAAEIEARVRETNKSLLQALIARRAEIERMATTPDEKRAALDFIDGRIAQVRAQLEQASE